MTDLAIAASAVGAFNVASAFGGLYAPDRFRRALRAFPRHEVAGWLLTAVALLWAGWLVLHTLPFSNMAKIDIFVYVGTPLCFFALVLFLDELLAARALGGLLLLVANPVLTAARLHPSGLSVVMTLLAYAWVVAGMILMISPFRFRRMAEPWLQDRSRFRMANVCGLIFGVVLLALGLTVFK